jgi:hypothetical protein
VILQAAQLVNKFATLDGTQSSLLLSQQPCTGSCYELDKSNVHPHNFFQSILVLSKHLCLSHTKVKFCTTFLTVSWDMHIQHNITVRPIRNTNTYNIQSPRNLTFLNDDPNSFCTKKKVSLNDVKHSHYL